MFEFFLQNSVWSSTLRVSITVSILTDDTQLADQVFDKIYALPEAFNTPSFNEHLELNHIKKNECKDIICHSCNRDLYSLEAEFSTDSGLLYCIDCYGYICKFCYSQGRKHSDWCSFPGLIPCTWWQYWNLILINTLVHKTCRFPSLVIRDEANALWKLRMEALFFLFPSVFVLYFLSSIVKLCSYQLTIKMS